MIGKAKSISHGINEIRYITGESAHKKHPEKIFHLFSNLLDPTLDARGVWESMQLTASSHPKCKNTVIRIEVSPAKEHTHDFTLADWQQLWQEFIAEFDRQVLTDEDGVVLSPRTNLANSKSTVWLHLESESGIPHLHAAVCRIDRDGNVNNDHNIHVRAQKAAERVAIRRGWIIPAEIRRQNLQQATADCWEAVEELATRPHWSWNEYVTLLERLGYNVQLRRDSNDKVVGYILAQGRARYKASELGRARKLQASRIEATWSQLHQQYVARSSAAAARSSANSTPIIIRSSGRPAPTSSTFVTPAKRAAASMTRTAAPASPRAVRPVVDYTRWQPGFVPFDISTKSGDRRFYIPEAVMQIFDGEFDYHEVANWQELTQKAVALFVGLSGGVESVPSGGGGGESSNLPWGRNPDEDDREWARRCAREALRQIPKHPKSRIRR